MKIIKLTLTIFLLNSVLLAQSTKPTFETGIRLQKAEFIPFDYSRSLSDSEPIIGSSVQKLRNNTKNITPFFFIYKDVQKGFSLEFDYTKIQLERANYNTDFTRNNQILRFQNYLPNNERTDVKLNLFLYPIRQSEYFALGFGLRKIDRLRNSSFQNYSLEEKFLAYGPQFVLKSNIPITEQLSINLGLDLYYTQGRRTFDYSSLYYSSIDNFSYIETVGSNNKTKGIFRGIEANIAIKYNFLENFNIAFGYNYNYSYVKYENLNDRLFYASSASNTWAYRNVSFSNGKEILRGFYISGSTIF